MIEGGSGALAYLDPGTGSLLIQVIIGTILAVPFFLRSQIARLYGRVRRGGRPAEPDGSTTPVDDGT